MEGGVLCIDGLMPEASCAPAQSKKPAATRDPFPQVLDGQPDHLVASLPQVAADSKPKLAEMAGQLQPSYATATGPARPL